MYVLGIDPGKDGGLALVRPNDRTIPAPVFVWAMPLTPTGWPDVREILRVIVMNVMSTVNHDLANSLSVFIEKVNAMPPGGPGGPRRAGAQSSFNFGKGVGYLLGMFAGYGIPTTEVTPQAWKKDILVGTDHSKAEAAAWAYTTFPQLDRELKRPRGGPHLGKIEALCIATHGARVLLGQKG